MSNEINGKISYPFAGSEKELNISGSMAVEDGKLNGVLTGSVEKDATGRVDRFNLTLNDLPFDGAGGGSGGGSNVEIVKIALGEPEDPSYPIPVLGVDKTFAELEAAVLAGKTIIGMLSGTNEKSERTSDTPVIFESLYDSTTLYYLNGEHNLFESGYTDSVLLNHIALNWTRSDALPTISFEEIELQAPRR